MASYRTRNGRVQARIYAPDGSRVTRTFPTKTLAKKWATAQEADRDRGEFIDHRASDTPFSHYADVWMVERRRRLAPGTWKRDDSYLRCHILPAFGERAVGRIRTSHIEAWLGDLELKESTTLKMLQIVAAVLDLARRDKAIASNPAHDIASKPKPKRTARTGRALTDTELSAVLTAAHRVDPSQELLVIAMARLGLRVGEALALRRPDFDLEAGTVTVQRSRDRDGSLRPLKGRFAGERRVIPLPHDVATALEQHVARQPVTPLSGDLFTTSHGTPLSYHNWRSRIWVRIAAEAGVGHVVPHDLRHTCITRLFVVDRWTPAEVQRFVGHSDPRITLAIYSHVTPESLPVPSSFAAR